MKHPQADLFYKRRHKFNARRGSQELSPAERQLLPRQAAKSFEPTRAHLCGREFTCGSALVTLEGQALDKEHPNNCLHSACCFWLLGNVSSDAFPSLRGHEAAVGRGSPAPPRPLRHPGAERWLPFCSRSPPRVSIPSPPGTWGSPSPPPTGQGTVSNRRL